VNAEIMQAEVVLVTGAGSGIGRSLVEEFHQRGGYIIFATDSRLSPSNRVVSRVIRNFAQAN
jgi:NAD(P)-dependent dehydrogenase (short-subunit alcohol dehydrogenase family)